MFRRKCRQALAQRRTGILLLDRYFGIVRGILDRVRDLVFQLQILPASKRRQGLESRNRQEPGGDGRTAFKLACLAPQIEKHLADEVFRDLFISHKPKPEAKHPDMVLSVEHLHGEAVALSDPADKDFVRRSRRTHWPSRKVGLTELAAGSTEGARFFRIPRSSGVVCDVPHKKGYIYQPFRG
jgi:hypothetical protein